MFKVLFITFFGIGLGYLVRRLMWVKYLSRSITYTIWILLFCFGLQVGANELVVQNLDTLGVKALVISVAGSLGSCVAAWAVLRFFLRGAVAVPAIDVQEELPEKINTGKESAVRKIFELLGGFVVVAFFAAGCFAGWFSLLPDSISEGDFPMYVLYLLMIQVGMSIGSDKKLKEILMGLNPRFLFLPLGTIVGTLAFVAIVAFFISGISLPDCLAIGSGFGYYSLSSVLITQIKEGSAGVAVAAQLGTVALMANIMREVITLLFAPLICKVFGRLAPISVGGATSMDSTLPVITAVCGKELVFVSIFHGMLVDFSVPFLVTFFASL